MTKKITITLEESLVDELNLASKNLGKKKTQIIRESLNAYLNLSSKEDKIKLWEEENKIAINEYNERIERDGLILEDSRMF